MGILEVKNVNKRFGGLQALGDVNLSIAENTVHAIIGPNGAGKSTLLNVLVGKLIPDTGSVMFDGQSVLGRKPFEINRRVWADARAGQNTVRDAIRPARHRSGGRSVASPRVNTDGTGESRSVPSPCEHHAADPRRERLASRIPWQRHEVH